MHKKFKIAGSFFGLTAVLIGAFGAHGLEKVLDPSAIATFETGVTYQMYHALLLLIIPSFALSESVNKVLLIFVVSGIFLFSFSIYGLATNDLTSFDFKTIGLITPLGGLLLIAAWVVLVFHFIRERS